MARRAAAAGPRRDASGTWGCGYSRPTPRIQYTASSFAQPAVEFFASLFHSRKNIVPPRGLFPQSAWFATESATCRKSSSIIPCLVRSAGPCRKLRWLQHGRVHVYVLYVGCTILALMIWYASVVMAPQPARRPGDTARNCHDSS